MPYTLEKLVQKGGKKAGEVKKLKREGDQINMGKSQSGNSRRREGKIKLKTELTSSKLQSYSKG